MGFKPVDKRSSLTSGAHFFSKGAVRDTENDQGWMSSVAYSPSLGHSIGLGFIMRGDQRSGEIVEAVNLLGQQTVDVEIVSPHFVDPEGERLRA